jgi:hypothetical protein
MLSVTAPGVVVAEQNIGLDPADDVDQASQHLPLPTPDTERFCCSLRIAEIGEVQKLYFGSKDSSRSKGLRRADHPEIFV